MADNSKRDHEKTISKQEKERRAHVRDDFLALLQRVVGHHIANENRTRNGTQTILLPDMRTLTVPIHTPDVEEECVATLRKLIRALTKPKRVVAQLSTKQEQP